MLHARADRDITPIGYRRAVRYLTLGTALALAFADVLAIKVAITVAIAVAFAVAVDLDLALCLGLALATRAELIAARQGHELARQTRRWHLVLCLTHESAIDIEEQRRPAETASNRSTVSERKRRRWPSRCKRGHVLGTHHSSGSAAQTCAALPEISSEEISSDVT